MCKERFLRLIKSLFSPGKKPMEVFSLKYMELDDSYFGMIELLIKKNPDIESLDLDGNFFTDAICP